MCFILCGIETFILKMHRSAYIDDYDSLKLKDMLKDMWCYIDLL